MKILLTIIGLGLITISCNNDNQFRISEDFIGPLTKTTPINEVKATFINDSVVPVIGAASGVSTGTLLVYEKGGKQLLQIDPKEENDGFSTVGNIRIFDERYKTTKGINLKSTFKDISQAYSIKRIENMLGIILLYLEDSDIYITIDKKYLPGDFKFDTSRKIDPINIPEDAPIKYLMIGWE